MVPIKTEYFINKTWIDTSELFIAQSQAWNSNLEVKIMTTGVEMPQQQIKSCQCSCVRAYITYFRHGEPFCYSTVAGWWITCCYTFLVLWAKLWKAASFVMSVCPSASPYGTTLFPLGIFSWNFVFEYFWTIVWRNSSFFKIIQEWQVFQLKTNIQFWWYHTYFFVEWEIFQKKL